MSTFKASSAGIYIWMTAYICNDIMVQKSVSSPDSKGISIRANGEKQKQYGDYLRCGIGVMLVVGAIAGGGAIIYTQVDSFATAYHKNETTERLMTLKTNTEVPEGEKTKLAQSILCATNSISDRDRILEKYDAQIVYWHQHVSIDDAAQAANLIRLNPTNPIKIPLK